MRICLPVLVVGMLLFLTACREEAAPEEARVHSYLEGRLTVNPEVDTIPDYRDFEVLVAAQQEGDLDTLGYAVTDSTGTFALEVAAPAPGIYPLIFSRRGTILNVVELAVAEGDSAVVNVAFPTVNRRIRVRSQENAAWMAYKNTKAQYNEAVVRYLQQEARDPAVLRQNVQQTSAILWSLRETFPGTIGADIAASESVVMLEGWDDSLLVARAGEVEAANTRFVDVARAARRAQARLAGQAAALDLLGTFQARARDDAQRAALQSEVVIAHLDSLAREQALAAARTLREEYAGSDWAAWADRAIYEVEHLMPGMPAPAFTATTQAGETLSLDDLAGQVVVLEFYRPEDPLFQRQLPARNALVEAAEGRPFSLVSVSLEPDTLLNEAFAEGRDLPGRHVIAPGGLEGDLARSYNVNVLPTRVLIDREGNIVRKYVGESMVPLQEAALALLSGETPPA